MQQQFIQNAASWWNEDGAFAILHRLNPVRLAYIRNKILQNRSQDNLNGIKVLDVGCGGGLIAEPLARMGANVTGIDATAEGIKIAKAHAKRSGLKINYLVGDLLACELPSQSFDVITALEVIEHVSRPEDFIAKLASLLKPNGTLILATLNRTCLSFVLGIAVAEYVTGMVPRGTHDWQKFITPKEMEDMLGKQKMHVQDITGVIYNPFTGKFSLSANKTKVNYMLIASF